MPRDPFEALAGAAAVITLPIGLLTWLFFGFTATAVVFIIGWFMLVPLFGILSEYLGPADAEEIEELTEVAQTAQKLQESNAADGNSADPLGTLRERYARGELSDDEFEQKLDRLVATDEIPEWAVDDGEIDDDAVSERETEPFETERN